MKNNLRGICTRSPDTLLQIVTVEEVLVLLTICIRRFLKTACGQNGSLIEELNSGTI